MTSGGFYFTKRIKRPSGEVQLYKYWGRRFRVGGYVRGVDRCMGRIDGSSAARTTTYGDISGGDDGSGGVPPEDTDWFLGDDDDLPPIGNPFLANDSSLVAQSLPEEEKPSVELPKSKDAPIYSSGIAEQYKLSMSSMKREWLRSAEMLASSTGQELPGFAFVEGSKLTCHYRDGQYIFTVPAYGTSISGKSLRERYRQELAKAVLERMKHDNPMGYEELHRSMNREYQQSRLALTRFVLTRPSTPGWGFVLLQTWWSGRLPKKLAHKIYGASSESGGGWRKDTEQLIGEIISSGSDGAQRRMDRKIHKLEQRIEKRLIEREKLPAWKKLDTVVQSKRAKLRREIKDDLAAINMIKQRKLRVSSLEALMG